VVMVLGGAGGGEMGGGEGGGGEERGEEGGEGEEGVRRGEGVGFFYIVYLYFIFFVCCRV